MNDVFKSAGQHSTITTASLLKLNQSLRKTNPGENNLSSIALRKRIRKPQHVNTELNRIFSLNNEENTICNYF